MSDLSLDALVARARRVEIRPDQGERSVDAVLRTPLGTATRNRQLPVRNTPGFSWRCALPRFLSGYQAHRDVSTGRWLVS